MNMHQVKELLLKNMLRIPIYLLRVEAFGFTLYAKSPRYTSSGKHRAKRVPMPSSLHRQAFLLGSVLVRRGVSEDVLISKLRSFHVWSVT